MKMRLLIFILTVFSFYASWSQNYHPFPDSNATWCDERYDAGWPAPNYYYFFYKTDGKSYINDTLYTRISDNNNFIQCYIREKNKKVFCRMTPDLSEFILYDFDLELGDTIPLPQLCGENFSDGWVVNIDSLLIGSEYHKRFFIQCWEWHSVQFIEGVGSDQGLMYCDLPWVDLWGDLHCFSLNDTIFETTGTGETFPGNCWLYIGIPENRSEHIVVYPNPVSDYIHVSYEKNCTLELTNTLGSIVCQAFSSSLDVRDLKEGLYFLKIYSETGLILDQVKILKLHAR